MTALSFIALFVLEFLVLQNRIQTQECGKYDNCIDCKRTLLNCEWHGTTQSCVERSQNSPTYDEWFSYYSKCKEDPKVEETSKRHCLVHQNKDDKLLPFRPYIDTKDVTKKINLYCEWEMNNEDENKLQFNIKITNPNKYKYNLIFYYDDNKSESAYFTDGKYSNEKKKVKKVVFYFLGLDVEQSEGELLNFEISKVKKFKVVYISLIVIGVLLIGICFGCCILKSKTIIVQSSVDQKEVIEEHNKNIIEEMTKSTQYQKLSQGEKNTCMICLEEFNAESLVVKLPCGHLFHSTCLKKWFLNTKKELKCPNCNFQLTKIKGGFLILNKQQEIKGVRIVVQKKEGNDSLHHSCPSKEDAVSNQAPQVLSLNTDSK